MSRPPFLLLPPPARAVSLATPRGSFAGLDARPAGRTASTVLLVPGFTGSKEDFLAVLEPLAIAGHRAVSYDQRGQHESPPADDVAGYAMAALAADLLAVARSLGDGPVHLLGHSFGGLVARAAVLSAPEEFRSLTLLCSGPAALPSPRADVAWALVQALPHLELETIYAHKVALERQAGAPVPTPEIDAFLRRRFLANCPTGLLRMAEQLLDEPDRVDELAAAGLPVHVAYGQDDDAWAPGEQADMARRLGARETMIPGAGHSPPAERPVATAAVLAEFWASLDPPTNPDQV